jgi:hypothetical protein
MKFYRKLKRIRQAGSAHLAQAQIETPHETDNDFSDQNGQMLKMNDCKISD